MLSLTISIRVSTQVKPLKLPDKIMNLCSGSLFENTVALSLSLRVYINTLIPTQFHVWNSF